MLIPAQTHDISEYQIPAGNHLQQSNNALSTVSLSFFWDSLFSAKAQANLLRATDELKRQELRSKLASAEFRYPRSILGGYFKRVWHMCHKAGVSSHESTETRKRETLWAQKINGLDFASIGKTFHPTIILHHWWRSEHRGKRHVMPPQEDISGIVT